MIPRVLLAGLLAAMAAGQLVDAAGFADVLRAFEVFGGGTVVAAGALPVAELAAAGGFSSAPGWVASSPSSWPPAGRR